MAWRTVGRLCVVIHAAEEPSDEEWDAYLDAMKHFPRIREVRVLIHSEGGGPTGVQRQKLQRQAAKHPPPVGVCEFASHLGGHSDPGGNGGGSDAPPEPPELGRPSTKRD